MPVPIAIWAYPASFIMLCTSAKSRFINPSLRIRSEILLTPAINTSSAKAKDCFIVNLASVDSNFSLGIIIRESTFFNNSAIPFSACSVFLAPSNLKGFVTTATVSISISFAISATTGAAPVPVPPPIPAVMKIILDPFIASAISSLLSWAEPSPIWGFPPAPSPRVNFAPIWIFSVANDLFNACASVFTDM